MWLWLAGCLRPDVDRILAERASAPEGLGEEAWSDGLSAWACAVDAGRTRSSTLGIADFSLPSEVPRLWVVDLDTGDLVVHDRVAHGSGSGERFATRFSPEPGSHATSLGVYRAGLVYEGRNGRSLQLDGLEPSNATARERAVVVHPSTYVDDRWVADHGRTGRSWGCFAVDPDLADTVIDALRGGVLLAWADVDAWRSSSPFLHCGR